MWTRWPLRARLTLLVVVVVLLGSWTLGKFAHHGLLNLLEKTFGLRAVTAAEAVAQGIDPQWLSETGGTDQTYMDLLQRFDRLIQGGNVQRIYLVRTVSSGEVEHVLNLPSDGSSDYYPRGTVLPTRPGDAYTQTKSGYRAVRLTSDPGRYMGGWAPLQGQSGLIGAVVVMLPAAEIQDALDATSMAIGVVMAVVTLLSGLVAYKFASSFEKTAVTDGLMGIYNHKYFKQRLEEEVAKSRRYRQLTSLVLFDIDFFKRVNDTYGHATGDLVLKLMAKWVTEMSRNTDVVCRYGGEEIACILPHTGIAGAQEFAERLRLKVSQQVVRDPEEDAEFRVTVSVGVAQWEKGMEMMDLIKAADAALYHSKRTGRNRVTIYQEELLPAPEEMASKPERTKGRR